MKILFVLENYIPHVGGVEILFKNLSEGLVKLGYDISIVTHRIKGTKKFEVINGVKIYRVNCFHSRYWFTFFSIPKVLKLAKKSDVIHTTTFNGAPPAWFVSKLLRKPSLITVHEVWVGKWRRLTEMGWFRAKIHDIFERMIYLLDFNKYVCISQSTQKQLEALRIKKEKISVIYPGVDYNHWNPTKYNGKKIREELGLKNNFVYLFYGRPGISKGMKYLIKAVPLISKRLPQAKLLAIVSKDGAYKKKYKEVLQLIKKLNIQDKVILHNPVPYRKLPNYVGAADCVVVPSLAEGFGFVVAESCAMGKPVVASNTTSLPEVVSGKFILVEPKKSKLIAEAVKLVFNDKTNKTKLKKFLLAPNVQNYSGIYKSLITKLY